MFLRVYSDIHLDWFAERASSVGDSAFWYPPELPDDKETILILAGDLWVGTKFIRWDKMSWISKVAPRFKQVLIVLGNHDYWPQGDLSILGAAEKCNDMFEKMGLDNVILLDMDTYTEGDYLFVGATLWTDMFKFDPLAMHNMSSFMRYDGKIAYDTGPNGEWSRFSSEKWVGTHIKHRDYIKHIASQNRDKKLIVITHHLPLMVMIDPHYAGSQDNAYYMSDLSDLILDNDNIKLWCCGHSHHTSDFYFEQCRMINNSVGYSSEHKEQEGLVSHAVIEVS